MNAKVVLRLALREIVKPLAQKAKASFTKHYREIREEQKRDR